MFEELINIQARMQKIFTSVAETHTLSQEKLSNVSQFFEKVSESYNLIWRYSNLIGLLENDLRQIAMNNHIFRRKLNDVR